MKIDVDEVNRELLRKDTKKIHYRFNEISEKKVKIELIRSWIAYGVTEWAIGAFSEAVNMDYFIIEEYSSIKKKQKSDATRKPEIENSNMKERKCHKCKSTFMSEGVHNQICKPCASLNNKCSSEYGVAIEANSFMEYW